MILTFILFMPLAGFAGGFDLGERVSINSTELGEQRMLQILLPENYQSDLKSTYPVIYLLDGDYNFHGISGMLDLLANKGQLIPKVILVGLADKGAEKYRHYMTPNMTPNDSVSTVEKSGGGADSFLAFLIKEVKPYIKQHYRSSNHSTLVGHSMGGLFVVNSLLSAPEYFDNYVAISPSVWVSDNAIVKKAKEKLGSAEHQVVSLYLSLADEMQMGQYALINELDANPSKNLHWRFKHYPDENHNSVGLIALRDSLKNIFKGWYLSEDLLERNAPETTLKHYENIQDMLGIKQSIPPSVVHIIVRQHYRQKKADVLPQFIAKAIERSPASKQVLLTKQASFLSYYDSPKKALSLLKSNESEFSDSIEYLKAIASTFEKLEDKEAAKRYYQKALELAKTQHANQWQLNIIQAKLL